MNKQYQDVYIHPNALVETGAIIGSRSRIWAFTHILSGAVIGEDCNICDGVFIENDVTVGDRVTIKCGVQLWDGICIENDVFIGPNVTFTNDPFPRSKQYPDHFSKTLIRQGASLGANATILPGLVIGANAMVGAGAVVTKNVPQNAIVVGNPARIKGYVSTTSHRPIRQSRVILDVDIVDTCVEGVKLFKLPQVTDIRGELSFGEYGKHLPFLPKRYFIVYDVPTKEVRGEHAHKKLHQFLICVRGSVHIVVDNGHEQDEILLDNPSTGLYVPPMNWAVQYQYSSDAMLLVLTSDIYDADDYIRDYEIYLSLLESSRKE